MISNNRLRVNGGYINDGVNSGTGDVRMEGLNDTIGGTGVVSVDVFRVDVKRRIIAGSDLLRINGDVRCPNNDTLLNFGRLTIDGGLDGVNSTTFFNGPNAVLKVSGEVLDKGKLHASSVGNEVHYTQTGATEQIIKEAVQGYYDLIIDGDNINGLKTLEVDEAVRNDLMILNSTLTFNGADSISIAGDLINTNGWLESGTSKVKMIGSGTQFIQGRFDFYDLTIDNTGVGVSLVSDTSVILGSLVIPSGTLTTSGLLRISSNVSGDGRIGRVDGGITGDVTVERYIDSGETGWRFLCAPVTGATFDQWKDDFITSGFPGSHHPEFNFASIYTYDETFTGNQNNGFEPLTSITTTISPTSGYWVYSGDSLNDTDPFTIDVTGPVNVGNVSFPVSFTLSLAGITHNGWNLVSNPYASSIDWDASGWTKLFIDNAVYVWNTDLNQYASYVGGLGTNGGSNAIASSQAFYVKANSLLPTLTITESCKLDASSTPFLRERGIDDPVIRLTLSDDNGNRDETVVRINDAASYAFDSDFDAYYLTSNTPTKIYTQVGGDNHSIETVPLIGIDSLPLFLRSDRENLELTYALNDHAEQLCIALLDKKTSEVLPIDEQLDRIPLNYSLEDSSRYELLISSNNGSNFSVCDLIAGTQNDNISSHLAPTYANNGVIVIRDIVLIGVSYEVYNILGQKVLNDRIQSQSIDLNDRLKRGVYLMEVKGHQESSLKFSIIE